MRLSILDINDIFFFKYPVFSYFCAFILILIIIFWKADDIIQYFFYSTIALLIYKYPSNKRKID